ncbi:MAG: arsenite methyltransferase [Actinobacteria bacterium]|nr:arsenite methyltransferase [Actinomycetota bacterium]
MRKQDIKKVVRENYAKVANSSSCCCGPGSVSYCGQPGAEKEISSAIGYSGKDMEKVPEGSNLGLGCGNPIALTSIKEGEIVLDLGSGAGFDCFLASDRVGPEGKVIGVDMTFQMINKARENAQKGGYKNVEFRQGEIENLPVKDNSIDLIISNCVVNLSPDKDKVFKEAFRVLKPGGRIMVSDIVLKKDLPDFIKNDRTAYVSCISGAIIKDDYLELIKKAGFMDIKVLEEVIFPINYITSDDAKDIIKNNMDISNDISTILEESVLSIKVSAIRGI